MQYLAARMNLVRGQKILVDGIICIAADCDIYGNNCLVLGMNCNIYGAGCIIADKSSTILNPASKYIWEYSASISRKDEDLYKKTLTDILQKVGNDSGTEHTDDPRDECGVCMDRKKNMLLLPCCHITSCTQCVREQATDALQKIMMGEYSPEIVFKCGICNSDVKDVYRVFF